MRVASRAVFSLLLMLSVGQSSSADTTFVSVAFVETPPGYDVVVPVMLDLASDVDSLSGIRMIVSLLSSDKVFFLLDSTSNHDATGTLLASWESVGVGAEDEAMIAVTAFSNELTTEGPMQFLQAPIQFC